MTDGVRYPKEQKLKKELVRRWKSAESLEFEDTFKGRLVEALLGRLRKVLRRSLIILE